MLERLVASAALLADLALEPSPGQRARLANVGAARERYAAAVPADDGVALPPQSAVGEGDDAPSALTPVIAEARAPRARAAPRGTPRSRPARPQRAPPVAADALTNPRYAQFALKVTPAAMLSLHRLYRGRLVRDSHLHDHVLHRCARQRRSDYPEVHAASRRLRDRRRARARFDRIPRPPAHDVDYATRSPGVRRGPVWQAGSRWAAIAPDMQVCRSHSPSTSPFSRGSLPAPDVTEVRDRFIGIVLGVVVMALVFSYVWPECAGTGMVESLAAALRRMGEELAVGARDSGGARAAAWQALAEADRSAELYAFEPEALTSPVPNGASACDV